MKIGILTYHRAYNYGAFLQAFALKSFLEKEGYEVSFVDYWPLDHEKLYRLWDETSGLKSFLRNLVLAWKRNARYKRFRKLQQKYLIIDRKPLFRSAQELNNLNYDVIIYGSDQIWWKSRTDKSGFDPVYWGQQINKKMKKVSYAASMGIIDLNDKDLSDIRNYLVAFSSISVREIQLMNVLQPLTDKTISVVLDPTLLVPASFWESLCREKVSVKGQYILYYRMMGDEKSDLLALEISRKLNLPIVKIVGSIGSYKVDRINSLTDPIHFLTLIRSAEYVISTSFHGVALSIQFNKEFYSMGMKNNSDRVSSLLSLLGLENRMIDSIPSDLSDKIDYTAVLSKLSALQKESAGYLTSSIQI